MAQNSILKTKKRKELDLILEGGRGAIAPSCPYVAPPLTPARSACYSSSAPREPPAEHSIGASSPQP